MGDLLDEVCVALDGVTNAAEKGRVPVRMTVTRTRLDVHVALAAVVIAGVWMLRSQLKSLRSEVESLRYEIRSLRSDVKIGARNIRWEMRGAVRNLRGEMRTGRR